MKTLILVGTKHGFTQTAAEELARRLPGSDVLNVALQAKVDLADYDQIVLGSSIYVGQINKQLAQLIKQQLPTLLTKQIGLFVCCGQAEKAMEQLAAAYPVELVEAAQAKGFFGYGFTQLGLAEKLVCKAIGAPIGTRKINHQEIERFAQELGSRV